MSLNTNNQILLKITNLLVVLTLVILSLAIFANSMTKPLGHDEHMYCTAGVLLADGKLIYRDFSYVAQMPYHPLLCAALFKVLNTTYYLLTARVLSSICDILAVICIVGIYYSVFSSFGFRGRLLAMAAAALYVFNPFVNYANGFAWNHDLVVLCVIASFWIFQTTDFKQKSKYWRTAIIGALLTFATCSRITTALVQLLFFLVLLTQPADSIKQRLKNVLPFLISTAAFLIWPVWVIIQAPQAFSLNLFHIPALNGQLLHKIGMYHGKGEMAFAFITTPACFVLILIAIHLCITLIINRRKLTISNGATAIFAVLLTAVFFITAFIPMTMWTQYFAMPVPFLIISFALPLLYLRKLTNIWYFKTAMSLIAACVLVTVFYNLSVLRKVPKLLALQNWTAIRLHRISEDIAEKTKSPKLILTLAPLFALEGSCNIYTEFSAGPFVYRIADYMSESDRQISNAVGRKTLRKLFTDSHPSAVILGLEGKTLEAPLYNAAEIDSQTWKKENYGKTLLVYFKR